MNVIDTANHTGSYPINLIIILTNTFKKNVLKLVNIKMISMKNKYIYLYMLHLYMFVMHMEYIKVENSKKKILKWQKNQLRTVVVIISYLPTASCHIFQRFFFL